MTSHDYQVKREGVCIFKVSDNSTKKTVGLFFIPYEVSKGIFNLCLLCLRFLLYYIALLLVLARHAMIASQSSVKCERNSFSVKQRVLWVQRVFEIFFPYIYILYFRTNKTVNTRNISWMLLFQKVQSGVRKLNLQHKLVVLWLARVSWSLLWYVIPQNKHS